MCALNEVKGMKLKMKKGFTLVELLGVIVVLGIIGMIVVPAVQGIITSSSSNLCKNQIKSFEKAAKNYVSSNPYKYECNNNESIELNDLITNGYLEKSSLSNPKGGTFSGSVKITVTCNENGGKTNYKYKYEYKYSNEDKNCE